MCNTFMRSDIGVDHGPPIVIFLLLMLIALCESFFSGGNVVDNAEICDLSVLGGFVSVDEKQVLVPFMST